ncbi:hypothetical protein CBS101457_003204 [Exobasidium rhododendri]|nr:hypothetical protein CBS101457_003204 [Exobasidium rhododendri]
MAPSFDCCVKVHYHKGTPVGTETKIGNIDTYVTGSESSGKVLLMVADVYGWKLNNTRVLADRYAEAIGARVYLPDYFNGNDLLALQEKEPGKEVMELLQSYHPREAAWPRVAESVKDIRKANPNLKKIGAIGYCWGATSCLYLSNKKAGESQVDAIAFAHPSVIEASDFEQVEKPGLFMTCEVDTQFPKEKQEESKLVCEKIAKEGVFTKFSYYPRVSHGWSIKGDGEDPYSATAMNHAAVEAIGFFSLELS